ncbi:MAG: DNA-3-methyladenine glycosylase I [Betaproteobacteria bacterium]|nr:DNA-3-methyladenine glycosylase I [Betaproteobacteria bacterium]
MHGADEREEVPPPAGGRWRHHRGHAVDPRPDGRHHQGPRADHFAAGKLHPSVKARIRCPWCENSSIGELYLRYHDEEWGVPVHDDRVLFEFLILEGAQAGLSWSTILAKRDGYRKAFAGFDAAKVARFRPEKVEKLLQDPGIVRNRLKVNAAVTNAKAFLAVQKEFGSFDRYIWQFVGGQPKINRRKAMKDVPARTVESDAMSKDLAQRGFKFVGSTICYAFMQATGMVDDHLVDCFRYRAA